MMPMQPATLIISLVATGVLAWGAGRLLARRIPPWYRRSWGILIVLLVVVGFIAGNTWLHFFSRECLRLFLMFITIGWIIGLVGYQD